MAGMEKRSGNAGGLIVIRKPVNNWLQRKGSARSAYKNMRFYVPAELFRHGQQTAMQNPKPVRAMKVMRLLISGSSEKISSATGKLVRGCVGPRRLQFSHGTTMVRAWWK